MKNLIKNGCIAVIILISTTNVQAAVVEFTQNTANDVYAGVKTFNYEGGDYNFESYSPLTHDGPEVRQLFGQYDDIRVANQYALERITQNDLGKVSCYISTGVRGCTEVLDWEYRFTHTSGKVIKGYYDNYGKTYYGPGGNEMDDTYYRDNITFDWETLQLAQADQDTDAINFISGDNFTLITEGVWMAETFLEGESLSSMKICVGGGCSLSDLDSISFAIVESDDYVIESYFDPGPQFVSVPDAIPEPGSIALFGLGFLLLGRRIAK